MANKTINISLFSPDPSYPEIVAREFEDMHDTLTLTVKSMNGALKSKLRRLMIKYRDTIYNKMTDGHTYIIEGDAHTLKQLAVMKHPYSRARPAFAGLHNPPEAIHVQHAHGYSMFDRDFLVKFDDYENFKHSIGFNNSIIAQRWRWLKYGTSKMVGRDLEGRIYKDHIRNFRAELKKEMTKAFVSAIHESGSPGGDEEDLEL